jgi:replicative DNA helicase
LSDPQNLQAEQAILGAVLFDPRWVERLSLRAEHFSEGPHGALWDEMLARHRAQRLIDVQTLREWAERYFSEIGGVSYLMRLYTEAAPLARQIEGYAELLRSLARRRAVIIAAQDAIALAGGEEADPLAALEVRLQEIAQGDADADAWEKLGVDACESIERAELGEARGLSTGFADLDRVTGGLQPGTLWVIGGATSMGKSLFGSALSRAVATQGVGVGEVHLEMDRLQIGLRTATALAFDVDHRADNPHYLTAQRGELKPAQWDKLRGAAKASATLPIYIDARPGRSLSQIEAAARRLFRKMQREGIQPGALIIDHEGLIAAEQGARFPSQLERTNARSEGLLSLAKRLGVAVVALSQITKEGARADGDDRLPNATDLNYGGAISQAASVVILLHRKAYYAERKPAHLRSEEDLFAMRSRECTLVVDKARSGQRSHVKIWMDVPTGAIWGEAS